MQIVFQNYSFQNTNKIYFQRNLLYFSRVTRRHLNLSSPQLMREERGGGGVTLRLNSIAIATRHYGKHYFMFINLKFCSKSKNSQILMGVSSKLL